MTSDFRFGSTPVSNPLAPKQVQNLKAEMPSQVEEGPQLPTAEELDRDLDEEDAGLQEES